jgi:hypothetical protein
MQLVRLFPFQKIVLISCALLAMLAHVGTCWHMLAHVGAIDIILELRYTNILIQPTVHKQPRFSWNSYA